MTLVEYAILRRARQVMTAAELAAAEALARAGDRGDLAAQLRLRADALEIVVRANEAEDAG